MAIDKLSNRNYRIAVIAEHYKIKELEEIHYEMRETLKNLKFWVDSLYRYNGLSKSKAKKIASSENGKKGGRPPKEITSCRRLIAELEDDIIPSLEKEIRLSVSSEEESEFRAKLEKAQKELALCREKFDDWKTKVRKMNNPQNPKNS